MIAFSNLAREFSDYRQEIDINDTYSNNYKYVWELPADALEYWKDEIDPYIEKFTTDEIEAYKSMFQVGKKILGIYVGAESLDTYARLYQLTEYTWHFTIPDILCSVDYNIIRHSPYSRGVTLPSGHYTELPLLIKPRSVRFTNVFDGWDIPSNDQYGNISGYGFDCFTRDHNRRGQESIYGFVDYQHGDIHLVRSHVGNEIKFERYYDLLVQLAASSGSSSSSGGGGGISVSRPIPYDYATISGELIILAPPITTVLEVDTFGDPH